MSTVTHHRNDGIDPNWKPILAWLKSLPLALGIPIVLLVLASQVFFEQGRGFLVSLILFFYYLLLGIPAHFFAYAIFGIPLFVLGRLKFFTWFWTMKFGWALAIVCAIIAGLLGEYLLFKNKFWLDHGLLPYKATFFGAYGIVTGFAAWLNRPATLKTERTITLRSQLSLLMDKWFG